MLENSVSPLDQLRAVKDQSDQLKTHLGKSLTYEQYLNLLKSAASTYDSQFKPKTWPASRTIYEHEVSQFEENSIEDFGIDSSIDIIQTYMANRSKPSRPPEAFMSRNKWNNLTVEAREI